MVDRIVAQIRPLLVDALAKMCADGGGDLAAHFALQLPIGTLMAMFDIGYQDAAHLVGLTRRMVGYRDAPAADGAVDERLRLAQVQAEIFGFFAELMDERQGSSGEDAVSRMLAADLNGSRFTEAQILYNCLNIAVGGNETTSHTTCAGVLAFTQHPAEWDRLTREPTLLPSALEEVLRWSSTNAYVQRVATKDILVRDKLISAGDSVTLWNVSANRDEEQFPEPERFDIGRSPNHHLTFGSGIHRCIGAVPGMAELTEVFSALLNGRVRFRLCGEPEKMRSNFILGYTALPLEVLPLVGR
ncbi:cytochrome P450 [Streptomyces decoyicus]